MKKYLFFFIIVIFVLACGGKKDNGTKSSSVNGAKIFKTNCVLCHGEDGKLGLNNAKDLTQSKLTKDERIEIVTNGKNAMTGFSSLLSKEEINAVVAFTFQLK